MHRLRLVAAALAVLTAACGSGVEADPPATTEPAPVPTSSVPPSTTAAPPSAAVPAGPSALDEPNSPEFPPPLVAVSDIISGGPPPDGIPPIDDPRFVSVPEADEWLDDAEPVVVVEIEGDARAYPAQILIWHEIVNDTVAGVPVAVTYCPLCNSAVTYERNIGGVETTFGTSGRLYASALVMYDRATESLWTHYDGRAVVGVLTGTVLDPIPSPLIAWAEFKASHPGGLVLDRAATGHVRDYGANPYAGYDDEGATPFLFRGIVDDRAAAMTRVVGVTRDGVHAAWALAAISGGEAQATNTELADGPLVILWRAGQASALDDRTIAAGTDVGSVGVFDPVVDGRALTFAVDGADFVDEETGTRWDLTGRAVAGELAGTALERIHHLDTFWFAWSTYRPGTSLVTP